MIPADEKARLVGESCALSMQKTSAYSARVNCDLSPDHERSMAAFT